MPARARSGDVTIVVAAGLAMALLTVISFLLAPAESVPRAPGSSYSAQREGAKAAYLLLIELGHDVQRSFEPLTDLRADPAVTTLLIVTPLEGPSRRDKAALASFVEAGGVVVAFGRSAGSFLPGVERSGRPSGSGSDVQLFPAALPGALTRGAAEVSARRAEPPILDGSYVPVYGGRDSLAVVAKRLGAGRVIWSLDSTPIYNDGIQRAANARFLVNASGSPRARRIVWDEYYRGERRSFWSYVAATPLGWGAAQVALVALAALAMVSRRRGPLRARIVEPRSSPLEFIDTMASLYERAGAADAAVEASLAVLRRRLAAVAGLSPASNDERLAAAAAPRMGLEPGRITTALAMATEALRRERITEDDALRIVCDLQTLRSEADHR